MFLTTPVHALPSQVQQELDKMDLGALCSEEGVQEHGSCLLSCANYLEALQVGG
jgi:hypothetical protein